MSHIVRIQTEVRDARAVFAACHRRRHLPTKRRDALDDGEGNVTQPAKWKQVRLEKRRGPTRGELVEAEMSTARVGVLSQR